MSFSIDITGFVNRTIAEQNRLVKGIVKGVHESVDMKSPVGDPTNWQHPEAAPPGYVGGRFRANWQLGIGSAPSGVLDSVDPSGSSTRSRVTASIPGQAAGKVYYLVNNLPYAQALEDGHSLQSPPGNMVAGTVAAFQRIVNEEAARIRR